MRPACYVAGPMRTRPAFNFEAFRWTADILRAAGWVVYNPAEMDALDSSDPVPFNLTLEQQKEWTNCARGRKYAARDLDVIVGKLRAEQGDALVVLEGIEESVGGTAEVAVARWVDLRILTVKEALEEARSWTE
jgi:Domain of unknown function (DUF4406)